MNSNSKIIPDTVLESSFCKKCLKYLSISPIGVHDEGGNICGRCLERKDRIPTSTLFICDMNLVSPEDIPFSLLGHITRESLFPCVNRFEGCRKLLRFSEISQHEQTCRTKQHQCHCGFRGVGSQLVVHFKTVHKKLLSDRDSTFSLDMRKDFRDVFLYRLEEMLFLIRTEYVKETNQYLLDTECLSVSGNVSCRIRLDLMPLWQETVSILSDTVRVHSGTTLSITLKIDDFRICEATRLKCNYKVLIIRS
nr:unnamed protein product [Callosobruchus analis]